MSGPNILIFGSNFLLYDALYCNCLNIADLRKLYFTIPAIPLLEKWEHLCGANDAIMCLA